LEVYFCGVRQFPCKNNTSIMNILITGAFGFVGANLSKAPESLRVGEAPLGFNLNSKGYTFSLGFRLKFGHQRMASLFFT